MDESTQIFHEGLIESLRELRAYAHLLARNATLAEDLVQDTLMKALQQRHQFEPGTNLRGWLIIILRHCYFNLTRRHAYRFEQSAETVDISQSVSGGQEETLEIRDFKRHFNDLSAARREALLLVGVSGFSYEEAAEIVGCAVGTMKSRVSRARTELTLALSNNIPHAKPKQMGNKSHSKINDDKEINCSITKNLTGIFGKNVAQQFTF